jgi:hypothetical protein
MELNIKKKLETLQKEEIMKRMQIRYNKYFKHWRDFDLLTCILAMIGLILAIVDVFIALNSLLVRNEFRLREGH